jgi:hypothetical protein
MTNIGKYEEFILGKAISESALYISPELDVYLSKIDSPIAKELLSMAGSDIKPDVTFLDLGEKEGELTFATMRNAKKRLEELYHGDPEFVKSIEDPESRGHKGPGDVFWAKAAAKVIQTQHPEFWKASRNPARIGRLIGQIFPGKYSNPEIEKFVNQFKAAAKKEESFIMAEGEDINKWYWHENYLKVEGDLGRSCMAKKKGLFSIYVENPEKVRLLVLLEDGKVKGRAIVWKVDRNKHGIEYYMDRQYTIEQPDVEKFRNFAKEKGWAFKAGNNHHSTIVTFNGTDMGIELTVTLNSMEYDEFPYMDSFKRFDPTRALLHNDDDRDEEFEGQYILDDTGGGYTEIESGVWSEWHGRNIPRDEAVWSDPYDDYILDRFAVYVEGRGYFHEDDDCVVYCEWDDRTLHEDDCRWSEEGREWINNNRAVRGVYKIDKEGNLKKDWYDERDDDCVEIDKTMRWYEVLSEKNSDWDNVSRMKLDIADRWSTAYQEYYPKIFRVSLYRAKDSKEKIYLSVRDAKILGFEYDKEDKIVIDDFEYHKRLGEAGPEGDSLLSRMIDLLVNDLIPNTERIADEGEEDMKKMYEERLERIWEMMPNDYQG